MPHYTDHVLSRKCEELHAFTYMNMLEAIVHLAGFQHQTSRTPWMVPPCAVRRHRQVLPEFHWTGRSRFPSQHKERKASSECTIHDNECMIWQNWTTWVIYETRCSTRYQRVRNHDAFWETDRISLWGVLGVTKHFDVLWYLAKILWRPNIQK